MIWWQRCYTWWVALWALALIHLITCCPSSARLVWVGPRCTLAPCFVWSCMILLVSCIIYIAQLGANKGPWVLVLHWSTLSIVVQVCHICFEPFVVSLWISLEGCIVVHYHNPGGWHRGIVLESCMLVWWGISILPLYVFHIAFHIFTVMSLLKLSCLSSVPQRYFTSEDICIVWLPVVNGCLGIF